MALKHFAKLGLNGEVLAVLDLEDEYAPTEKRGIQYLTQTTGWAIWRETSESGDRKNLAGIGDKFDEDKNACVLLCAFYSAIKNRCNTSVKETSEIVYNSLKSKCLKDETYEDFYKILNKHNLKLGFKANIPFLNSELKKGFEAFEKMYLFYETKMQEKGEI